MPTIDGRPITLVTAPEKTSDLRHHVGERVTSFREGAAAFRDDWLRDVDRAQTGPRVRLARGTTDRNALPREATDSPRKHRAACIRDVTVAREQDVRTMDPEASPATALGPASGDIELTDFDAPAEMERACRGHARALSPTVEVNADMLDEVEPRRDDAPSSKSEPACRTEPSVEFEPSHSNWLGTTTSEPQVGARLVISAGHSREFTLSSAVTLITPSRDGVFVQTCTNSHYFIAHSGDAFLVACS